MSNADTAARPLPDGENQQNQVPETTVSPVDSGVKDLSHSVTVVTTCRGEKLGKSYDNEGQEPTKHGACSLFIAKVYGIVSLAIMAKLLKWLEPRNTMAIAMGYPSAEGSPIARAQDVTFFDRASCWLFLDFDKNTPEDPGNLLDNLPVPLAEADAVGCRTSSHRSAQGVYKYRFVFHLNRPLFIADMKRIAAFVGADTSIYSAEHLIFTATPWGAFVPELPDDEERVEHMPTDPPQELVDVDALLDCLPPEPPESPTQEGIDSGCGDESPRTYILPFELRKILSRLPVEDYRDYDGMWFPLMAASYHATRGRGFDVFNAWADTDALYQGDTEERRRAWAGLETSGPRLGLRHLLNELKSHEGEDFEFRRGIDISSDLYRMIDESIDTLSASDTVFQRSGELVRLIPVAEAGSVFRKGTDSQNRLTPRSLSAVGVQDILSRYVVFNRFDARSKKYKSVQPPKDLACAVVERGEYPGIHVLTGIATTPFMRPDGSIFDTDGFDIATGCLLRLDAEYPPIPLNPSKADAAEAFASLREPFADFPFADKCAADVPVAAVLTILGRPLFSNVPGIGYDASTRGSGKTLICEVIGIISTGRPIPKLTWPANDVELEKLLSAVARDPVPVFSFDNLGRKPFGGAPIDKVLTANDLIKFRILGRSEAPELPWRSVVCFTDNNVSLYEDTARRVLVCRLEPDTEHPEDRTGFQHADLLGWVRENRPQLVAGALTILRAWIVAGRPPMGCAPWGSFERWSMTIPPAILYAGGANVRNATVPDVVDEDTDAAADIFAELSVRYPEGFTIADLRNEAGDEFNDADILEVFKPVLRTTKTDTDRFHLASKWLSKMRGRVSGGRKLTRQTLRANRTLWKIVTVGGEDGEV